MGLCIFGHFNFSESLFLLVVLPVPTEEEVAKWSDEASDCSIPAMKNFNYNLISAIKLFHNKHTFSLTQKKIMFAWGKGKVCSRGMLLQDNPMLLIFAFAVLFPQQ